MQKLLAFTKTIRLRILMITALISAAAYAEENTVAELERISAWQSPSPTTVS